MTKPAPSGQPADERRFAQAIAGRFIVFEGPDGSGKSTQLRLTAKACKRAGVELIEVREPGGTFVGERIRTALLEHSPEPMSVTCEMLLYMASRAQLVEHKIRPAIERGACVLADRFVASTLAYQGAAGGMSEDEIRTVAAIATGGMQPHQVVVFDVDEHTAATRLNPLMDRMEAKGREFHRRVRAGYHAQAGIDPGRYLLIDASPDQDTVWRNLLSELPAKLSSEPESGSAG
ncbi:MAG: dTMP kinase [Planctomycetota bacterium]